MEIIDSLNNRRLTRAIKLINCSNDNFQENQKVTALMIASTHNYVDVVKSLLSKCDLSVIDMQNENGFTALMIASRNGNSEIVKELLSKCNKDSIEIKNKNGHTAFMWACFRDRGAVIKEFVIKCVSDSIDIFSIGGEQIFRCSNEIQNIFDFNTGIDTTLKYGKYIKISVLSSLHSLKPVSWLNMF